MRFPAFIRYLPARLSPVANPIVWIPMLALGLVGVFAWEYYHHPDWLALSEPATDNPADTTGLTPEERGQIAELDTLDVLLNDPNLNNPELSAPSTPLSQAVNPDQSVAPDSENRPPFSEYLDQYSFSGIQSQNQSNLPTPSTRNLGLATPSGVAQSRLANPSSNNLLGLSTGLSNTTGSNPATNNTPGVVPESALARAIQQLSAATNSAAAPASDTQASALPSGSSQNAAASANRSLPNNSPSFPSGQPAVIPGSLPGNPNVSFIQTTPSMSPPPGTTGYTPPSSLNLSTFNRSLNRGGTTFPSSIPTATPTFGLRQPQSRNSALPNPGDFQTQTPQPGPSPYTGTSPTNTSTPDNAWDAFWGGY